MCMLALILVSILSIQVYGVTPPVGSSLDVSEPPSATDVKTSENHAPIGGKHHDVGSRLGGEAPSLSAWPKKESAALIWDMPTRIVLEEYEQLDLALKVHYPKGKAPTFMATGLPPGASADLARGRITFQPDFIQGDHSWTVLLTASDGVRATSQAMTVQVKNSIRPPEPTILRVESFQNYHRYDVNQVTDDWLDSPGYAGRGFGAIVTVPIKAAHTHRVPVCVILHGYGGTPGDDGSATEIRIWPHDPYRTYWWGYASGLPEATTGEVRDYTHRRVMHVLDWVLRTIPGADAERVYIKGASMGGAGALSLGLRYARHFAFVDSTIGQTIARNHRPSRIRQLSEHWGTPEQELAGPFGAENVWDAQDMSLVLATNQVARQQYVRTHHGKDDPIIHFGAVVHPSPKTGMSWFRSIQALRIGHFSSWDEGGHGTPDPVLGDHWSDRNWDRMHDEITYLRRDAAFPAFTNSSINGVSGVTGNGKVAFDVESGFAADVDVPGDTGWNGDIAGTYNRFLRWDSRTLVDIVESFEIALWVAAGLEGAETPSGYPSIGSRFPGTLPVMVDVTPRRTRAFRCADGEAVAWSFGPLHGTSLCEQDGVPTIRSVPLTTTPTTLRLHRQ